MDGKEQIVHNVNQKLIVFGMIGQGMGNAIPTLENNINQDLNWSLRNVVDLVQGQAVSQDLVKVRNHFMT